MFSPRLPEPIDVNRFPNYDDIVNHIYEEYFKKEFMDRRKREKLHGTFIFLEMNFINYKPERFWHLLSYKPNDDKYTLLPCVNTIENPKCARLKGDCNSSIFLPQHNSLLSRSECLYRLRRINWINPIIRLANAYDSNIKEWTVEEVDLKGENVLKRYIRFQEGMVDYLIILREAFGKSYKFISAFPVVHKGSKLRLDDAYQDFCEKKGQS